MPRGPCPLRELAAGAASLSRRGYRPILQHSADQCSDWRLIGDFVWSSPKRFSSSSFLAMSLAARIASTTLWRSHSSSMDMSLNCSRFIIFPNHVAYRVGLRRAKWQLPASPRGADICEFHFLWPHWRPHEWSPHVATICRDLTMFPPAGRGFVRSTSQWWVAEVAAATANERATASRARAGSITGEKRWFDQSSAPPRVEPRSAGRHYQFGRQGPQLIHHAARFKSHASPCRREGSRRMGAQHREFLDVRLFAILLRWLGSCSFRDTCALEPFGRVVQYHSPRTRSNLSSASGLPGATWQLDAQRPALGLSNGRSSQVLVPGRGRRDGEEARSFSRNQRSRRPCGRERDRAAQAERGRWCACWVAALRAGRAASAIRTRNQGIRCSFRARRGNRPDVSGICRRTSQPAACARALRAGPSRCRAASRGCARTSSDPGGRAHCRGARRGAQLDGNLVGCAADDAGGLFDLGLEPHALAHDKTTPLKRTTRLPDRRYSRIVTRAKFRASARSLVLPETDIRLRWWSRF